MKPFITIFLINLSFCASISITKAQQAVLSSGGEAQVGNTSISIGQVLYTNDSGTNGSVNFGVQQSLILFETPHKSQETSLTTFGDVEINVYPNPASTYVIIQVSGSSDDNLAYTLIDIMGKTVAKGIINRSETNIPLSNKSTGIYLLKLTKNNQLLQNHKLIKL